MDLSFPAFFYFITSGGWRVFLSFIIRLSIHPVGHFVQKSKSVRRLCRLPRHRNHTVHLQLLSLGRRLAPPQVLEQLGHGFMRPVPAPVTRVGTPGRQIGYMDKYGVQLSVF
jgi:hypothetical protein